jgi:hypothetical protein
MATRRRHPSPDPTGSRLSPEKLAPRQDEVEKESTVAPPRRKRRPKA